MDSYHNSCTSNSASSTSNSSYRSSYNTSFNSSNDQYFSHHDQEKNGRLQPAFRSALHSVRKLPTKNIITKKPIAPMPPTPPRVYKVEAVDFRDVVQKLTGAVEYQPTRLREAAPPPLSLSPLHRPPVVFHPTMMVPVLTDKFGDDFTAEAEVEMPRKSCEGSYGALSPLGFSLSPSSLAWCSSIMLSPGTLSAFEPSAVL